MNWLGGISYGYWMTIVTAILLIRFLGYDQRSRPALLLVHVLAIMLTIGLAGLSYQCVERRFLRLKDKAFAARAAPFHPAAAIEQQAAS